MFAYQYFCLIHQSLELSETQTAEKKQKADKNILTRFSNYARASVSAYL